MIGRSTSVAKNGVSKTFKPEFVTDQIKIEPESGCWEWTGSRMRDGRGVVEWQRNGRRVQESAPRIAYQMIFVGPIGAGLFVCHHCDNPPCVNPEHLYAGTPKQNFDDMIRRGRGKKLVPLYGMNNHMARPVEEVRAFVDEYERRKDTTTLSALAREFGLPRNTARNWALGINRGGERN